MFASFMGRSFPAFAGLFLFSFLLVSPGLAEVQTAPEKSIAKAIKKEAPKPHPDTLILTNGDTITGQFVRVISGNLTFHSDLLNLDLTMPLDKIRELHSRNKMVVLPKGQQVTKKTPDQVIPRGTISVADNQITIVPTHGENIVLPTAKVAHILDYTSFERELHHTPAFWQGWNGNLSLGATVVSATQDSETFSGSVLLYRAVPDVSYLPARSKTSVNFSGSYGRITQRLSTSVPKPLPDLITDIYHAGAEHDSYFSARFYTLAQTAFDHNSGQSLDLQQIYGGGLGWTVLKSSKQQLDLKATLQYERQSFLPSNTKPGLDLVGSTYTFAYIRKLPYKAVFNQQVLMIPAYNTPNAFSASETDSLSLPVYKRLSLVVSTLDSYLLTPPPPSGTAPFNKPNSFQFTTGISYSLK